MVDATIVPVPKQRNSREEDDDVKAGKTPEAWEKNPAKNRQKDKDARWTKKHGKSFYGYKNHVNADARHKLIRQTVRNAPATLNDASVLQSRSAAVITASPEPPIGESGHKSSRDGHRESRRHAVRLRNNIPRPP
jgi:hypothetical protein